MCQWMEKRVSKLGCSFGALTSIYLDRVLNRLTGIFSEFWARCTVKAMSESLRRGFSGSLKCLSGSYKRVFDGSCAGICSDFCVQGCFVVSWVFLKTPLPVCVATRPSRSEGTPPFSTCWTGPLQRHVTGPSPSNMAVPVACHVRPSRVARNCHL